MRSDWQRVNRQRPCPICGKPDWCLYAGPSDAPNAVICPRVESDQRCGEAGWLHRLRDCEFWRGYTRTWTMNANPSPGERDFASLAGRYRRAVNSNDLIRLADQLGVTTGSLVRLGIGWSLQYGGCWAFPMMNGHGCIIGSRLRRLDGRKLSIRGGREGLFMPQGLQESSKLLVCEGPTDTAALLDLRFMAVGRPSCSGGVQALCDVAPRLRPTEVVIVSDRDGPGQRGAENLASVLVAYCPVLRVIVPPFPAKDARDWVQRGASSSELQALTNAAPRRTLSITSHVHGGREAVRR
jgi:hypothetical protein